MSLKLKATLLVDNRAMDGLTSEHALSLWVETGGRRILFDTGQGTALLSNAARLGIDLQETDALVLSHGHCDHTGGIPQVLRRSKTVEMYCHPGVVRPRYSVRNGKPKRVHMPHESAAFVDQLPLHRLHWVFSDTLLSEGIGLTGPITRLADFENTGKPFFLDPEGRRDDSFEDELALWVGTSKGLIVFVGCGHAGLVNTLQQAQRLSRMSKLRAVIGGFHLNQASDMRLERTAKALRFMDPELVVPCHCTGKRAVEVLRNALGGRVAHGCAGMNLDF
jgi:7,8-dihydropterin-6-yl-methyl-4-(beta-D-ribofuranosyl)aminobenzene 5'-phosphate synthase